MITLDESAKAALKMGESPMLCAVAAHLKRVQDALRIYDIDKAQAELSDVLARIDDRLRINAALLSRDGQ